MYFNVKKIDDNKLLINDKIIVKETFKDLFENSLKLDNKIFYDKIKKEFNFDNYEVFKEIDNIAYNTQVCIKNSKSKIMWLHGHLLYVSLCKYLDENPHINFINILETGTARGFSSLCMAKALNDKNRSGKIYTFDIIPNNEKIYWNCIDDFDGKKTREELLVKNKKLLKYIEFIHGDSLKKLKKLSIDRIHFSFLDARHNYKFLKYELDFVKNKQLNNDVIICDDYTFYNNGKIQYPGINKTIDEIIEYSKNIFYGNDGNKKRGYVYMKKNN